MKKHILFLAGLATSIVSFTSCSEEEAIYTPQVEKGTPFTVFASTAQSRTVNEGFKTNWEEGDQIQLSFGETTIQAPFATAKADGEFIGSLTTAELDAMGEGTNNWVAVYPYKQGDLTIDFPAVTTQAGYNSTAHLAGANCPLYGVATDVAANEIPSFSMKHMASVVEVKVVNAMDTTLVVENVAFSAGNKAISGSFVMIDEDIVSTKNTNVVAMTKVENGAALEPGQTASVYLVVKPFTASAAENDTLTVWVNDTPNQIVVNKDLAFSASKIKTTTFEYKGDFPELYVMANAGVFMEAERIIPDLALNSSKIQTWAQNLKDQPNTRAIIEEAITYITLKNYRAAYDVLGGVPGFVRETKTFEAVGSAIQKVDYTGVGYLVSMLEGIEGVNDIESLLAYLTEFEEVYEASGAKNKLDASIGDLSTLVNDNIDAFIESILNTKPDENLDPEAAFNDYKTTLKKQLEDSKKQTENFVSLIKTINKTLRQNYLADELPQLEVYIEQLESVLSVIDSYTYEDVDTLHSQIDAITPINYDVQVLDPTKWGASTAIKLANNAAGYTLIDSNGRLHYTTSPQSELTGQKKDYLEGIRDQIAQNQTAINATKAAISTALGSLQGASLVESLEEAVNNPDSYTSKFLYWMFSQESFMNTVKSSLREIIETIEKESQDNIDSTNASAKANAIKTAKENAIIQARIAGKHAITENFNATNESNLNSLPWTIFQAVLNWDKCQEIFVKLEIAEVYDALVQLSAVVEEMITFDAGSYFYNIEEIEDYQEGVDYWVLKPSEMNN